MDPYGNGGGGGGELWKPFLGAVPLAKDQFYLCPNPGCNSKYKTSGKLLKHLDTKHPAYPKPLVSDLVLGASKDAKKDQAKKQRRDDAEAVLERRRLEDEARAAAQAVFKEEVHARHLGQLRQQEEAAPTTECLICLEPVARGNLGHVAPCGHTTFCYSCINDYNVQYGQARGCPSCRGAIVCVSKVYL